jgi:chemotaxis protein MotB
MKSLFGVLCLMLMVLFACVPAKKYQELKANYDKCVEDQNDLRTRFQDLEETNNELNTQIEQLKKKIASLEQDTSKLNTTLAQMNENYQQLKETCDFLTNKNKELLKGNKETTEKLMAELHKAQTSLQNQEDALRTLEGELQKKKQNLEKLQAELEARSQRVKELESILARKDSAVKAIKEKVQKALLGFEGQGLKIEQKNGKVYVSLDESLLFASGSYTVEPKGVTVLKKLGSVLEQNKDINILVEGHTDNVPYHGSGDLKDNWDLSVKRATSVVKILVNNSKIAPKRITAAGRSEYVPLDPANTPEARKKNRRTEIILNPKLDELFDLLDNN